MSQVDVIRMWKDPVYRASLGPETLAAAPRHPGGLVELTDEDLKEASGIGAYVVTTFITCTEYTFIRFRCCPKR